jgi:hypothetical protein
MLKTLGLSVIRGRDLTDAEGLTRAPVAVINQAMAKKFWPAGDPLGARFRTLEEKDDGWFTIVGIAPGQLTNVSPADPLSFAAVSIFLTVIAFIASYVPARRATAVDPLVALRAE